VRIKEIYVFEEEGRLLISDQYNLTRISFPNVDLREKWLSGHVEPFGIELKVIRHAPDVMANLTRGG